MKLPELLKCLQQNEVRYVVCGGFAVNLYGIPRMTADIDFLLEMEVPNLAAFQKCLKQFGFEPRIPIRFENLADEQLRKDLLETKNLIAYSFYSPADQFLTIDVVTEVPFAFSEIWNAKETRTISDFSVNILEVSQLIAMKEKAGRKQDLDDVATLKRYFK